MRQRYVKSTVQYTDDHGRSSEQCSKCAYFIFPDACEIVIGRIKPGGWCNQFLRYSAGPGKTDKVQTA